MYGYVPDYLERMIRQDAGSVYQSKAPCISSARNASAEWEKVAGAASNSTPGGSQEQHRFGRSSPSRVYGKGDQDNSLHAPNSELGSAQTTADTSETGQDNWEIWPDIFESLDGPGTTLSV